MSVARNRYAGSSAPEPVPLQYAPDSGGSSLWAWLVTKLLALTLLFGASGLLYYVAASDDFRIESVVVVGSQLIPSAEIERAAAVAGLNIFWVREEEVGHRLQAIAAVQSARARTVLPDRLEVRIVERAPVAVWQNGGMSYLVDAEGRVLQVTDRPWLCPRSAMSVHSRSRWAARWTGPRSSRCSGFSSSCHAWRA